MNWDHVWFDSYTTFQSRFALYGVSKNNLMVTASSGKIWHFAGVQPTWKTDIDYNAFDWGDFALPFTFAGNSYSDLDGYAQASGLDLNSVRIDKSACFANLQLYGPAPTPVPLQYLALQPGCKAVDAGVPLPNINDGFLGTAPDMGAHELGDELPLYGPRDGIVKPPTRDRPAQQITGQPRRPRG